MAEIALTLHRTLHLATCAHLLRRTRLVIIEIALCGRGIGLGLTQFMIIKARGDDGALHLTGVVFIDQRTEDDVRIGRGGLGDDARGFINFKHAQIVATRDVEQDTLGTVDADFEQGAIDRGARGFSGTIITRAVPDAHEGRAGILHNRFHVREVDVDESVARDQIGNAFDCMLQHLIHHLERFGKWRGFVDQGENFIVRNRDERINFSFKQFKRLISIFPALCTFKTERTRHDTDRQDTHAACQLRNDRHRPCSRTATETRRDEEHVRPFKLLLELFHRFFRGTLADLRIRPRTKTARGSATDRDLLGRRIVVERLDIGIHSNEFNAADLAGHHAGNRIGAATADADDADHRTGQHVRTHLARGGSIAFRLFHLTFGAGEERTERIGHGMWEKKSKVKKDQGSRLLNQPPTCCIARFIWKPLPGEEAEPSRSPQIRVPSAVA